MNTEKVILRIGLNGELLGQYNNAKHAANKIHGHFQNIYTSIETKTLYKKSYWFYGFIKKEIEPELLTISSYKEEKKEILCLKCDRKFMTCNKRINHVCPECNIVNDNLWENNTIYKTHVNL